jgi:hypothetical protein
MEIKTSYLLSIFKNLKDFKKEATLNFTQYGLKIKENDDANIALFEINLNKELFNLYTYSADITINVNSKNIYNALKEHKKENVYMEIEGEEIALTFSNGFKTKIKTIEKNIQNINITGLNYSVDINIDTKQFKEILKSFKSVGDKVTFDLNENGTFINVKNEAGNLSEFKLNDYKHAEAIKSSYSIDYLIKFKEFLGNEIKVYLENYYPIKIVSEINNFKINYIIAPIVEQD